MIFTYIRYIFYLLSFLVMGWFTLPRRNTTYCVLAKNLRINNLQNGINLRVSTGMSKIGIVHNSNFV